MHKRAMRMPVAIAICFIAAIAAADGNVEQTFDVTGRVIAVSGGKVPNIYLSVGTEIVHAWDKTSGIADCQPGKMVRLVGYAKSQANDHPALFATNIAIIAGYEEPPIPPLVNARSFLSGKHRGEYVSVRGVLSAAVRDDIDSQWNWIVVSTDEGRVCAAASEREYPLTSLTARINSEVILRGFSGKRGRRLGFIGDHLFLSGINGISTLRPAPKDPFSAPPVGAGDPLSRQTCEGQVVGSGRGCVFLSTKGSAFMPIYLSKGAKPPETGSFVTVAGFVSAGQYGPQLTEALVRIDAPGGETNAAPSNITAQDLFIDKSQHSLASFHWHGRVIRIRGWIDSSAEIIHTSQVAILDIGGGHRLSIDLSNILDALPTDFGHGYEVAVAGICYVEFDTSLHLAFPAFKGFTVYPRDAGDIAILRRPLWWTPARLLILVCILAVALVAFLVWNRTLRTLSARRGRELAREQLRHAKAELKVEERTRLAVELHDSVSQTLVGAALQIETALGAGGNSLGPARRFLEIARQMMESCRQELRGCLWDLRNRTFDERDVAEMIRRTIAPHVNGVELFVRFDVLRESLSESAAHAILRITRELVLNAVRHGKAQHVRIDGEQNGNAIRFSVEDDGLGFDPAAAKGPAQGHFGLQGVRERAKEMSGGMTVESAPGKGTKIYVELRT